MTCIVGVESRKGVWIGGDSLSGNDWAVVVCSTPKVFKRGGMLFGGFGSWRSNQVLQHEMSTPARFEGEDAQSYLVRLADSLRRAMNEGGACQKEDGADQAHSGALVAFEGLLYEIQGDFSVVRTAHGYNTGGSGYLLALGALAATAGGPLGAKRRLKVALRAAALHTTTVRKPWQLLFQPRPEATR